MKALSKKKKHLLGRLGELIARSRDIDLSIPEDTGLFSLDDDVVKKVRALLREASDLIGEVMACYEAEAEAEVNPEIAVDDDEGFLKEIGAHIASQMAVQEVAGLAFISRGQLLDNLDAFSAAVEQKQLWKVASVADSGLRRMGRALVAIESAIRECEGMPSEYRPWQDLDDSLETRRIYGELRRAVLLGGDPDQPPAQDELRARMLEVADHMVRMRSTEIYPYLRIDDRLEIKKVHKRIVNWLAEASSTYEDGSRLWGDLVSFVRLLAEVNRRQELREHDRLAVNGLYRQFFGSGTVPELTPPFVALLEPLLGLEDELDEIILHPERHGGHDLKAPFERLRRELGKPFESSPHTDFLSPVET